MSFALFVIDKVLRFRMKRRFRRHPDVLQLRRMMKTMARERPVKVPSDVQMSQTELGGVPTEVMTVAGAKTNAAILYLHGGGFVAGAPETHRALTYRFAQALSVSVYSLDYRLAPEHPFPAAVDDTVAAYKALVEKGVSKILIGGDSAGGNLTLVLALKIKELGLQKPAGLVCLSPCTELASPLPANVENQRSDAMFAGDLLTSVIKHYVVADDAKNPFISPLRGDVSGLPPTLFQCSKIEILRDDSLEMASKMRRAGVAVTVQAWPKVFHVWQVAADVLPEARTAIADIVTFAKPLLS